MSEESKNGSAEVTAPYVEEIEAQLKTRPDDLGLREDLAQALTDRHLLGAEGHLVGSDEDIKRLKEIVSGLPEDAALYPRAYLAHHEQRDEDLIRWSGRWADAVALTVSPPYDCDELYYNIVLPFESVPEGFWRKLAETLRQGWGDSAAVFMLQALANAEDGEPDKAIDNLILALDKDANYWLAAWVCGQIYTNQKNWHGALGYYKKALKVFARASLSKQKR